METKDWIALLVPIASNGLLLFLFQQAVLQGNKREDRRNDYQYQTLLQLLELLQKYYTAVIDFKKLDEKRSGQKVEFFEVWNPAQELIVKINIFHETHPITTQKVDIQKCASKWDEISLYLYESRVNNGGCISEAVAVRFSKDCAIMLMLIRECLQQCEKEILRV